MRALFGRRSASLSIRSMLLPVNSWRSTDNATRTVSEQQERPHHDDGFDRFSRFLKGVCTLACSNKQDKKGCFHECRRIEAGRRTRASSRSYSYGGAGGWDAYAG